MVSDGEPPGVAWQLHPSHAIKNTSTLYTITQELRDCLCVVVANVTPLDTDFKAQLMRVANGENLSMIILMKFERVVDSGQ